MRLTLRLCKGVLSGPYGTYQVIIPSRGLKLHPKPIIINQVPPHIPRPPYVPSNLFTRKGKEKLEGAKIEGEGYSGEQGVGEVERGMIKLGGGEERAVRRAGKMAAEVLHEALKLVKTGVTTNEIDLAIHNMIIEKGAYPSPLGYMGFQKSCTTSINNVICHGVPDDRQLKDTDLINLDITLFTSPPSLTSLPALPSTPAYHGDTSRTISLPNCDIEGLALIAVTREALERGIAACGPGKPFKAIGEAIEGFAREEGFAVNRQFTGHGVGRRFHTAPWILHYKNDEPGIMRPGHCFTIEPSLVQSDRASGFLFPDNWTVATDTGARSAQFEHQVLITETGVDVLTRYKGPP